jgi:UDP-N-acetylmuramate-alanine ligase
MMGNEKTKFNIKRFEHQLLASAMTVLVDDFGYTPREVFELMDDAKRQLWGALAELANERKGGINNESAKTL